MIVIAIKNFVIAYSHAVVDFTVNNSFVVFSSGNPCSRKAYFSALVQKLLACGVSLKRIPRSIDGNTPETFESYF